MEKFSNWRDGPTGIHPLLPPKMKPTNIVASILINIIGLALFIIRLPLIIVFTFLLVGSDALFKKVQLGFASRFLNRFFSIVFGRFVLIGLGFNKMDEYTETLTKSQLSGSLSDVKLNDVIVCNHTSYVDIIYLAYRYSPTFAVPPNDTPSNTPGYVVPLTLWEALMNSISCKVIPSSRAVPLVDLSKSLKWNGPVALFVEGTTSNGSGLLATNCDLLNGWSLAGSGIHVIGIYYPDLYPIYTSVGSFLFNLIRLASRLSNSIEVMYLSRTNYAAFDKNDTSTWYNSLMNNLAALVHARRTQISAHNKLSFVAYWYGYKVNYKKDK